MSNPPSHPHASTPSPQLTASFLADYTAWLWGCGATCIRIHKNVARMAEALGVEADVTILPHHVEISVKDHQGVSIPLVCSPIHQAGIDFAMNTRLSRLSWSLADGKIDFHEAQKAMHLITHAPKTAWWQVLLLTSLANASFCRLFGGDAWAMLVVFIGTLLGFRLKQIMTEAKRDVRITFFCCAFFSSAVCVGATIFGWGDTPQIALATSVLYLIPGVPYINAVSDLIDKHYLCSFARFMDAVVLTVCLSAGLTAGMFILGTNWF